MEKANGAELVDFSGVAAGNLKLKPVDAGESAVVLAGLVKLKDGSAAVVTGVGATRTGNDIAVETAGASSRMVSLGVERVSDGALSNNRSKSCRAKAS